MIDNQYGLDPTSYTYDRDITRARKVGKERNKINLQPLIEPDTDPFDRLRMAVICRMILDAGLSRKYPKTAKRQALYRHYAGGVDMADGVKIDRVREVLDVYDIKLPAAVVVHLAKKDFVE